MDPIQAEAIKRRTLKRYLTLSNFPYHQNSSTAVLQAAVKLIHRKNMEKGRLTFAWPLTPRQVMQRCYDNHYVKQLVCMKQMFGPNSGVGCVTENGTVHCKSIADLIKIGWVSDRYAYLDQFLAKLPPLSDRCKP